MVIITTVMKVHIGGEGRLKSHWSIRYLKQKFIKTNKNPKQQNRIAVWHVILIMLFSRSHLFPAVPMLGFGWAFGAALCGFFSMGERISLPEESWLAVSALATCAVE